MFIFIHQIAGSNKIKGKENLTKLNRNEYVLRKTFHKLGRQTFLERVLKILTQFYKLGSPSNMSKFGDDRQSLRKLGAEEKKQEQ